MEEARDALAEAGTWLTAEPHVVKEVIGTPAELQVVNEAVAPSAENAELQVVDEVAEPSAEIEELQVVKDVIGTGVENGL